MASLGHIAVGLAAGRYWAARQPTPLTTRTLARPMLALSALSLLPDLDVLAFPLGIPYAHPFGHRGATHSLLFAALAGLVVFLLSRNRRFALLSALVVATHGLLDAATDGGLGVATLWPFSNERFFLTVRPIRVAPIGLRFFTARGLSVALSELGWFAPLLFYALWPRRRPR